MLSKGIKSLCTILCFCIGSTFFIGCDIISIDKNKNPPVLEDYNIKNVDEIEETLEVE